MAQSIVDIVLEHVPADKDVSVQSVKIRLGDLSGVIRESLEFCFDSIIGDTPLQGSRLDIERVPAKVECRDCHRTFVNEDWAYLCPSCRSANIKLISGTDLQIVEIVVEDQE